MISLRRAVQNIFTLLVVSLLVAFNSSSSAYSSGDGRPSPEEQKTRASELYKELVAADLRDYEKIIRLHRAVIDECPDTERAQESLWRLSNLYLQAYNKPDYPKIIALMELLLKRYPDSPLAPHAKQRLLMAYEDVGNMKAARTLYEDAVRANPTLLTTPEYAAFQLGYANALAATGDREKAQGVCKGIIAYGASIEVWLREIAADRLRELSAE